MSGQPLGYWLFLCLGERFCVLGAVPVAGRVSALSVPRSLKMAPERWERPMGPATPYAISLQFCPPSCSVRLASLAVSLAVISGCFVDRRK